MALVLFVKKIATSSAVRVDEGWGGRKSFEKCVRVRTVVNFVVVVCRFSSGDICREEREEWLIHTKISGVFFYLGQFLSVFLLSLERCSQRTSDSQGADDVVRAGLDEGGQKLSKQDVRVEQRVPVALFVSSAVNWECEGSEDETLRIAERERASVGYAERWPAEECVCYVRS